MANYQAHPDAGFGLHRVIRMTADRRYQGVWPIYASLPSGWFGSRLLEDGGILPYMPPTSGLSFHRDVAERMFPLSLEPTLVSCPDQLITRLAPLLTEVTCEDEALSEYRLHGKNNYGPDRVTAASFKRELDYCEVLWNAQKRFLHTVDPEIAEKFQRSAKVGMLRLLVISTHASPKILTYGVIMIATSRNSLVQTPGWCGSGSSQSTYPLPVFDFAVNLLIRQSWLKQLVSRLKECLRRQH